MTGKLVAYCDGKREQVSRIEKMLAKNRAVFRPELKKERGKK